MMLLNIFETLGELGFVVKIMVFAYVLYWLFVVFREQQMLLGLVAIIAAYFMFFHSVSVIVLVLLFFVFIVMSGHFQFIIDMGILPIMGMLGFHEGQMSDEARLQEINKKLTEGQTLSGEEVEMFKKHHSKQEQYQEQANRLLTGGYKQGGY